MSKEASEAGSKLVKMAADQATLHLVENFALKLVLFWKLAANVQKHRIVRLTAVVQELLLLDLIHLVKARDCYYPVGQYELAVPKTYVRAV